MLNQNTNSSHRAFHRCSLCRVSQPTDMHQIPVPFMLYRQLINVVSFSSIWLPPLLCTRSIAVIYAVIRSSYSQVYLTSYILYLAFHVWLLNSLSTKYWLFNRVSYLLIYTIYFFWEPIRIAVWIAWKVNHLQYYNPCYDVSDWLNKWYSLLFDQSAASSQRVYYRWENSAEWIIWFRTWLIISLLIGEIIFKQLFPSI